MELNLDISIGKIKFVLMASVIRKEPVVSRGYITVEHKRSLWSRIAMYMRSKRQAFKILKALNEAEQIHKGHKQGKSYDQFLKEI
jgi:hypothetical protein